ncbi:MAG: sigma factor [Ruminococcus sp.]
MRIKAGENVVSNNAALAKAEPRIYPDLLQRAYAAYEIEDLIQQGYFGMCNAVNGADPENGVSFLHYASFWIGRVYMAT